MQQQGDRRQPTTNLAERVLGKDVPACATSWFEVHGVNESDRWLLNALEGLVEVRTAAINLESLEAADREQVSEIVSGALRVAYLMLDNFRYWLAPSAEASDWFQRRINFATEPGLRPDVQAEWATISPYMEQFQDLATELSDWYAPALTWDPDKTCWLMRPTVSAPIFREIKVARESVATTLLSSFAQWMESVICGILNALGGATR